MPLIHVGIRPKHKLVESVPGIRKTYGYSYEIFPDGSHRRWSKRMLTSGCDKELLPPMLNGSLIYMSHGDLIHCEHCDEFFSRNQFLECEYEDSES